MSTLGDASIEGAWQLESYARADVITAVSGILLLTSGQWSTLYFVPQAQGQFWGSAESGRYTIKDHCLTFYHQYTFQGGSDKSIVMDMNSEVVEECRIELAENLTIFFPSGSVIRCRRHAG